MNIEKFFKIPYLCGMRWVWIGVGFVWAQMDSLPGYELAPVEIGGERVGGRVWHLGRAVAGPLSLERAFEGIPGVSWMATGVHSGRPVLRGLSYQRILALYGGLVRDGDYWGEDHGWEVPAAPLLWQGRVLLGPQAVRYGSGAMGGVVAFDPVLPESAFVAVRSQVGQNPLLFSKQAAAGWRSHWGGLAFETGLRQAHNYREPWRGYIPNTGLLERYVGSTGTLAKAALQWWVYGFEQQVGLPPDEWDPDKQRWLVGDSLFIAQSEAAGFGLDRPRQRIQNLNAGLRLGQSFAQSSWIGRLGVNLNRRAEYGIEDLRPGVDLQAQRLNLDLECIGAWWRVGAVGMLRQTWDEGIEGFGPAAISWEGAWWGQAWRSWGAGAIHLGVRWQWAGHRHQGTSRRYHTCAVELSWDGTWAQLRLARSFRIPHPIELWANGFHEGARRYEIGRVDLPVEIAYQVEGSMARGAWRIGAHGHYFPNFIFVERLPDTLLSAIGGRFQYASQPAWLWGLEGLWHADGVEVTLAYMRGGLVGAFGDSLRAMPKVPPLQGRLRWDKPLRGGFYLRVVLRAFAPQRRAYTAYRTEIPTPGYWLLDWALGWKTAGGHWIVGVDNAFNQRYQSHLSLYRQWGAAGIWASGRNVWVRLEF